MIHNPLVIAKVSRLLPTKPSCAIDHEPKLIYGLKNGEAEIAYFLFFRAR